MNEKIELWFPTPIYYSDNVLGNEFKNKQETFLNHHYDTVRNDYMNVDTSHSLLDLNVHHLEKFQSVFDVIDQHVNIFAQKLGYRHKLKCETSWVNKSYKNDYLYPHVHSYALISGAYYIQSLKEDHIHFMKDVKDMKLLPVVNNDLNHRSISYPCVTDRIILFSSDTLHHTMKQKSDFKMTLSFNYK